MTNDPIFLPEHEPVKKSLGTRDPVLVLCSIVFALAFSLFLLWILHLVTVLIIG
jgi:hypothetical protein